MEVGTCHDGLCDLLAMDGREAQMTFTLEEFCKLYIREIVWLRGVLVFIVSNRDPRFTAHFWKSFQRAKST